MLSREGSFYLTGNIICNVYSFVALDSGTVACRPISFPWISTISVTRKYLDWELGYVHASHSLESFS